MDGRRTLAILYIYYIQAHISAQVRQKVSMVRMTNSWKLSKSNDKSYEIPEAM